VGFFVGELVASETVAELALVHDRSVGQHLHRPVHGGVPDALIAHPNALEQLIDGHVLGSLEERVDDQAPLLGGPQPALGHVRVQIAPQALRVGTTQRVLRVRASRLPSSHGSPIALLG
jgi:hypothetical protein